jgi:hypothetical protein
MIMLDRLHICAQASFAGTSVYDRSSICGGLVAYSMIRKSGYRFSEKIMLKQKDRAG